MWLLVATTIIRNFFRMTSELFLFFFFKLFRRHFFWIGLNFCTFTCFLMHPCYFWCLSNQHVKWLIATKDLLWYYTKIYFFRKWLTLVQHFISWQYVKVGTAQSASVLPTFLLSLVCTLCSSLWRSSGMKEQ